ncbi:MAG TPA: glycosyltransferase family 39 protein [Candidatus Polarisedimenticolaceae bacterium]|nr:glycosyltransferase family 39 protein [Candidatus Polarisedimenticolaceae bacterium]
MGSKRPFVPALIFLAAAVVLVAGVRLRLRTMPLERDEGEYAYFGQLLLHGTAPYAEAYSMKLPGIFVANAAIEGVFGQTPAGIRLGLLAVTLATTAFVFLAGWRLAGAEAGAIAAASSLLMSVSASVLGFAAHATQFVILFAAAGLYVLLEAIEREKAALFALAGLLMGVAITMKQHGAVFAAFGLVWLLVSRARAKAIGSYVAAAIAPLVLVFAWLAVAGVFPRFWFWCVTYAGSYATSDSLAHRLDVLTYQLRATLPLAGFGVLALLGPLFVRGRASLFASLLAVFAAAGVAAGFFFRAHYFVMLIPAVALLVALASQAASRRFHPALGVALALGAASAMIVVERAYLFSLSPVEVSRSVYAGNPFPEAEVAGSWLGGQMRDGERLLVLGSEPEINFYARRRGATGYVYMYGLMEEQPYAERMQRDLIAEAEAAAPAYVALVGASTSWLRGPRSKDDVFTWAKRYLAVSYNRVGVVETGDPPRATFGPDAAQATPRADGSILIFKRR